LDRDLGFFSLECVKLDSVSEALIVSWKEEKQVADGV
jgi:hypothetical protein